MIALPLTFSGLIVAYGFILGWGRAGFFTQLLAMAGADPAIVGGALFTPVGLAFASSYYLIPRVVMALLPVLVNFDRTQLIAAESLGATRAQAFRQVLLPQVAGPVASAACLVAAVVFGAYGTALALVGTQLRILPLQLSASFRRPDRLSRRGRARAADHGRVLGDDGRGRKPSEVVMNATLLLDRDARCLLRDDGRVFDPALCAWTDRPPGNCGQRVDRCRRRDALARPRRAGAMARSCGCDRAARHRPGALALAERLGAALAGLRLPVLCGGRGGVMEAVCKGVTSAGGVAIGLLPEGDPALANAYAGIVIATGIGEARNALIARAAACLVAVGDSYGTLSEVGWPPVRQACHRSRGRPDVDGVEHVGDVETALQLVAEAMLGF